MKSPGYLPTLASRDMLSRELVGHPFRGGLLSTELADCFPMGIKKGRPCERTVPACRGAHKYWTEAVLEDAWYPCCLGWWREPVLSLFLRAQVADCCSSPLGALQRHTHTHGEYLLVGSLPNTELMSRCPQSWVFKCPPLGCLPTCRKAPEPCGLRHPSGLSLLLVA